MTFSLLAFITGIVLVGFAISLVKPYQRSYEPVRISRDDELSARPRR